MEAVTKGFTRYTAVTGDHHTAPLLSRLCLYLLSTSVFTPALPPCCVPVPNVCNVCHECPCPGEATLRKAICADLQRRKGVTYAPEEIIVGNGAKQGVYQAILALCRYTEAHRHA